MLSIVTKKWGMKRDQFSDERKLDIDENMRQSEFDRSGS